MGDPVKYGEYVLSERISVGGMAEVFRARHAGAAEGEDEFVIKKLLPQLAEDQRFVDLFAQEARLASQLEHPNIARAIIDDATRLHKAVEADEQLADSDLSEIHFDASVGFTLILRSGSQVVLGFADPAPALDRLSRMRERGLNLDTPQRIDLDVGSVAIASPL